MNIIKRIIRDIQGDFEDKYSFRTNISQFQIADMDSITISPHDGVTSALDSKIGGMPYLPEKFTYPMDLRSGRKESPLAFLAQINFSQMPPLEGFPKEGILQFYIGTDSLFGLNLKDPTDNAGFRVIYFREPIKQSRLLEEIPVRIEAEAELPVKRPLQIG